MTKNPEVVILPCPKPVLYPELLDCQKLRQLIPYTCTRVEDPNNIQNCNNDFISLNLQGMLGDDEQLFFKGS